MYGRAVQSSPPIRTRPPESSTRFRTVAFVPTSAAVPVRSAEGMCRCARAIGRRKASEASEPTMNTISCNTAPPSNADVLDLDVGRQISDQRDDVQTNSSLVVDEDNVAGRFGPNRHESG